MIERQSKLDLAEYFSIGAFFFGLITTVITKQLLYSLTPLGFYLFFNTLNLNQYKKQSKLSFNQTQKIEQLYQDLIAYQDLINGNNDYKYQKLELEELIKKAKKHEIEFEHKINQYLTQTNFNSILNKLNNLESLKSHIEQEMQKQLSLMETRIQKIENSELEISNIYQSSIGESSTLTGLTQYYSLQRLTEKLIKEAKESKDIKYLQKIEGNKILTENNLKYVQQVAKHSQYLSEVVINYHNDHGCSYQDAQQLSAELKQLALELSMIRSGYDLRLMYKVITLFTYQISRFQHKKSKDRWNYSMRHSMLNVLNDCLLKI